MRLTSRWCVCRVNRSLTVNESSPQRSSTLEPVTGDSDPFFRTFHVLRIKGFAKAG